MKIFKNVCFMLLGFLWVLNALVLILPSDQPEKWWNNLMALLVVFIGVSFIVRVEIK